MAKEKSLTRIYDLRVLGGDAVIGALKKINDALAENAKLKTLANKKTVSAEDIKEIEKYRQRVKELTIEEQKLKVEQKELTIQSQQLANAKKLEALESKKKIDSLKVEADSYKDITAKMKELRPLIQSLNSGSTKIIDFGGKQLNFDQAIAEYKKLSAAEQAFRRQFTKDGTLVGEYTTGIVQAFKQSGLDEVIRNQVTKVKTELRSLDDNFDILKKELQQIQQTGKGSFDTIEREMIENRTAANNLKASLAGIEAQMATNGSVGNRVSAEINKGFASMRSTLTGVVAGYIGFQAAISKTMQLIGGAKAVSDSIIELEVNMGKAKGGADDLVEALGNINTRTTLQGLLDISDVALKAGVSNENLADVTEAIDKVKVAFGKDFGSIEQGTETFAKLINIFYADGEITGERILHIGNAIRTLANESVASVPYLTDFSGRMAGVKQIANVTLPEILGLGAGFEQFKQSAETSSTALVKIIPKLATDSQKYADILGITAEKYSELINNNPTQVLIDVAEKLVKSGKGIEDVAASFADAELGSGRITTILATLGGNADVFRERLARASETIGLTDSITEAFNRKNNNLAATLDKVSKKFSDLAGSKGFQITLTALSSIVLALLNNFGALLLIFTPLAVAFATYRIQLTVAAFQQGILNKETLAFYLLTKLRVAQQVVINGLEAARNTIMATSIALTIRANTATGASAVLLRVWGTALRFAMGPLGLIVTLTTALVTVFGVLSVRAASVSESMRKKRIESELDYEATKKAAAATAEQAASLTKLKSILLSSITSLEDKKKALDKAKESAGGYLDALELTEKGEIKNIDAIDKYIEKLRDKAKEQALVNVRSGILEEQAKVEVELPLTIINTKPGSAEEKRAIEEYKKTIARIRNAGNAPGGLQTVVAGNIADAFGFGPVSDLEKLIEQRREFATKMEVLNKRLDTYDRNLLGIPGEDAAGGKTAESKKKSFFERFKELVKEGTDADFDQLKKDIADYKAKLIHSSEEYRKIVALEKQIEEFLNPKDPGKTSSVRKPKSATEKLKEEYEAEKKQQETLFNDKFISEEDYNNALVILTSDYRDKKLKLIKAKNDEERKQQVAFNADLAKDESEALKQLFNINQKAAQDRLNASLKRAANAQQEVEDDPLSTSPQKLQARLDYLATELSAQKTFDAEMTALEMQFTIDNVGEAEKRRDKLAEIERQIRKTAYEQAKASYEERLRIASDVSKKQQSETEASAAKLATDVLNNENLTPQQKANQLRQIELDKTKVLLAQEVAAAKIALENKQSIFASEKEISEAKERLQKAQLAQAEFLSNQELSYFAKLKNGFKDVIHNLTDFFKGVKKTKEEGKAALNDAMAYAETVIKDAVSNAKDAYFEQQRQRVDNELAAVNERLDLEQQQVEATAQSEAEKESIRKQFDAKRKEAEKKAGEERKQIALKQAAIDFGVAVVKTLAAYPFPFSLIPVGALTVAYLLQRSQIQKQKFARGGRVPTRTGGDIEGPSHSEGGVPFNYEAEGGELAIINKKSAKDKRRYTVTGTPRQIASKVNEIGGGVAFAHGAGLKKLEYGGLLGANLRAPQDLSFLRTNSNGDVTGILNTISAQQNMIVAQSNAISDMNKKLSTIKVQVVAKEVKEKNNEQELAKKVGTL